VGGECGALEENQLAWPVRERPAAPGGSETRLWSLAVAPTRACWVGSPGAGERSVKGQLGLAKGCQPEAPQAGWRRMTSLPNGILPIPWTPNEAWEQSLHPGPGG
jgi:hypothetical protein